MEHANAHGFAGSHISTFPDTAEQSFFITETTVYKTNQMSCDGMENFRIATG